MKKKNGQLIFKAVVLLLSLIVIVFVASLAWFSNAKDATADGMSIKAISEGVEVSWNNKDFYLDLTAVEDEDVVAGKVGKVKFIKGEKDQPQLLRLITGDGLNFFEPYVNRRTGSTYTEENGMWSGSYINESSSNTYGKYVDIPLYFRSTEQRSVYLAGDSRVNPKDSDGNTSEYGTFSKDHISAASRVAFLNSTKNNCTFIWAPNENIELQENSDGYRRIDDDDLKEEEITVTTGGDLDLDGFDCSNTGDYYFWTFVEDQVITSDTQYQNMAYYSARPFVYDTEYQFYVTTVSMYIPTYSNNPTIPFFITNTDDANASDLVTYNSYVDGEASGKGSYDKWSNGQKFQVTNTDFVINNNKCSNGFKTNESFRGGTKITFKLAYNPDKKILVVLNYQSADGSFNRGDEQSTTTTYVPYYELPNNANCVLANSESAFAVSTAQGSKKVVKFTDSTRNVITPYSVTTAEQFTAELVEGTSKSSAKYKFKNIKTGDYLVINGANISFSEQGSEFILEYKEDVGFPLLKVDDYYLVVQANEFHGVTDTDLNINEAASVFVGNTFRLLDTSTAEEYLYYDAYTDGLSNDQRLRVLDETTTPMLFSTTSTSTADKNIGYDINNNPIPLVTLTKTNEDDLYYTGSIVMRIWVEGTDREAKYPLAGGIFNAKLHFTAAIKEG